METLKNCARSLNLDNNKGYVVAVLIALVFVSILLAAYYPVFKPPEKVFTTISLRDSQKKAIDYPELLVINQNNTFNVFVEVENHMKEDKNCTVLVKVTDEMIQKLPLTVDANATYTKTLAKGESWEIPSIITINKPGNYSVIFELWLDEGVGTLEFSENACILNVEVVN
ncbi:MAG TPA: DUF1616 domain-containing protein [Candidatus Bathyarchaeia archaeon]